MHSCILPGVSFPEKLRLDVTMTEEEMNFDPSIKKKKKKKKTAFDPDADGGDEEAAPAAGEEEEPVKKEKKKVVFDEDAGDEPEDIDLESFGKKKKKKKVREGLDSLEDVKEALPEDSEPAAADDDMDLDDFGSKKKKKKKNRNLDDLENEDKENAGDEGAGKQLLPFKKLFTVKTAQYKDPWTGSDRDYQYDEILQRVFGIMRDKNPEMVGGDRKKFVMRPPQVRTIF